MRPVNRGATPERNGVPRTVADYKDWRFDLIKRLGPYCSYCEMILPDSPQVEHVSPKSNTAFPARLLSWENMLLACGPCNRAKSDTECPTTTHLLPDYHNTYLAFDSAQQNVLAPDQTIEPGSFIIPHPALTGVPLKKAQATIALCGLDKIEVTDRASDLRWRYRWEATDLAKRERQKWDRVPISFKGDFLDSLIFVAKGKGFFSAWFRAFDDVPEVKAALIKEFPGTADCFDSSRGYAPAVRVPGDL